MEGWRRVVGHGTRDIRVYGGGGGDRPPGRAADPGGLLIAAATRRRLRARLLARAVPAAAPAAAVGRRRLRSTPSPHNKYKVPVDVHGRRSPSTRSGVDVGHGGSSKPEHMPPSPGGTKLGSL